MQIAIIDYGSGNLRSAAKAFERAGKEADLNCQIEVTSSIDVVAKADRIVLPGVGAFVDCRSGLENVSGMVETLQDVVINKARPFLGICVGTQLMAQRGLEKTSVEEPCKGFGWISGDVVEITPNDQDLKIPQIGWNTLEVSSAHPVLENIPTGADGWHAYFVHSYHIEPSDKTQIIATTDYGGSVTAIVGRDNIIGTQFHPEKSQKLGRVLITNFLKWKP